jgi:hypothetical protein
MRFMLPPLPGLRFVAAACAYGLFLYDVLGARKLLPAVSNGRSGRTTRPVGRSLPLKREFR